VEKQVSIIQIQQPAVVFTWWIASAYNTYDHEY